VLAKNLIGMIDVIAIPRLTRSFGTRLLHFGACAAAKACHEKSKRADNFQDGEHVFHIFLVPDTPVRVRLSMQEQWAKYNQMTPYKLERNTSNGKTLYTYADKQKGVVYIGGDKAYERYKELGIQQSLAL